MCISDRYCIPICRATNWSCAGKAPTSVCPNTDAWKVMITKPSTNCSLSFVLGGNTFLRVAKTMLRNMYNFKPSPWWTHIPATSHSVGLGVVVIGFLGVGVFAEVLPLLTPVGGEGFGGNVICGHDEDTTVLCSLSQ